MPRSNAHRLQITWNCDSHFGSPVLDWTVRSSPNFLKTGLDCGPEVPDRTVQSFLQSPFPCLRPDRRIGTGPYFLGPDCGPNSLDRTAVPILWTVQSGSFLRSPKKATVRTRPDRNQSICNSVASKPRFPCRL